MDKLEQYLDQVCRRLGGTRSMRQHVRQELAEHLRDAVAGHRAAGMSEEDALARALEDFGGPEQVRSELEATYGHRLLAVAIDKAIEWKERTMKAKWLWMSWAHLALVSVVAVAVLSLAFAQVFLVPKFYHILGQGWLHPEAHSADLAWMYWFLDGLRWVSKNVTWIVLLVGILWGLFEWRVRSDNKPFMRLAALGTAATGLTAALAMTIGSMLILTFVGLPGSLVGGERLANHLTVSVDSGVAAVEQRLAKKDWQTIQGQVKRAAQAMEMLSRLTQRAPDRPQPPAEERVRQAWASHEALRDAQQAVAAEDAARLEAALQAFHRSYQPVRQWAATLTK